MTDAIDPMSMMERFERLGRDEREILLDLMARLEMGQELYGDLNIDRDPRDWEREAYEEELDGMVYLSIGGIKRRRAAMRRAGM